jgi:hypothetical protein
MDMTTLGQLLLGAPPIVLGTGGNVTLTCSDHVQDWYVSTHARRDIKNNLDQAMPHQQVCLLFGCLHPLSYLNCCNGKAVHIVFIFQNFVAMK